MQPDLYEIHYQQETRMAHKKAQGYMCGDIKKRQQNTRQ